MSDENDGLPPGMSIVRDPAVAAQMRKFHALYLWFSTQKELVHRYGGRVVVMHDRQVVGDGDSIEEAEQDARRRAADRGDLVGGGVVARDDRGRIAGRKMQQQEHEHRDDAHHEHRRGQPPDDVGEHLSTRSALLPSPLRGGVGGGGRIELRVDRLKHPIDFVHHLAILETQHREALRF